MGIAFSHLDALVVQQVANSNPIDARPHEPCGAGVTQVMWPEVADTHPPASGREGLSDGNMANVLFQKPSMVAVPAQEMLDNLSV